MRGKNALLLVLLSILAQPVLAGNHKLVPGDALEARECYILRAEKTIMWRHRHMKDAGAWSVRRGAVICTREIDKSNGELWYKALIKEMATLDRSKHIPVWINSKDLMKNGVWLAY